ncbi:MAG: hypothetical protein PHI03_09200 [Bacteroidales bacterium]|nr:hypothetical protein [Bacteroidales bacterium]
MKKIIAFFAIAGLLFTLNSCEEGLSFKFNSDFKLNMDIDIEDVSKGNTYPFTHTTSLNIEDDEDVANRIEEIKGLEVTEIECSLTGIPEGESILELNVTVENVNLTVTLNNITESDTLMLPVSDVLLDALGNNLFENHQTSITVSGESTYAPMVLGVNLLFRSKIEASL